MAEQRRARQQAGVESSRRMTSPVNWALLGLLIESEDYGYRLAQRLERAYGEMLLLGSESHVYTALDGLTSRGLIEEIGGEPGTRRQPKVRYRARPEGLAAYAEWVSQQGRRGSPLFSRALSMLTGTPELALKILDDYEQHCLQRIGQGARAGSTGSDARRTAAERIVAEDRRLCMEGRLPWIELAREELEKLQAGKR